MLLSYQPSVVVLKHFPLSSFLVDPLRGAVRNEERDMVRSRSTTRDANSSPRSADIVQAAVH